LFLISVKPQIVREGLQKIHTVKVNRSHIFDVEVIGEPITDKLWYKEEATEPLEADGEKLTIENHDYSTQFSFTKAQRRDTAKYRIRVENENGFDEEWLELVVLGPPSRPMGPLTCTDITAHSCILRWEPPEDDGGMPVLEYEVEKPCPKTKRWIKVIGISSTFSSI